MSIVIKRLVFNPSEQAFRFFWAMYVRDVNLSVHCQPCLLGRRSNKICTPMFYRNRDRFVLRDIVLDESKSEFVYICGVTLPHVWIRNFHLALRRSPGRVVKAKWFGVSFEIENAERLEIRSSFIDPDCRFKDDSSYMTCRNAQFAWAFKKGLYLPNKGQIAVAASLHGNEIQKPSGRVGSGQIIRAS